MSLIAGIDPGSQHLGYAIVEVPADSSTEPMTLVESGRFSVPASKSFAERVFLMSESLDALFKRHSIDELALEKIFLGKNVDSAFKLGHIRGICLEKTQRFGIELFEYAARSVKKGVAGNGSASKETVQYMVSRLVKMPADKTAMSEDESDALALAYHHSLQRHIKSKIDRMGKQL